MTSNIDVLITNFNTALGVTDTPSEQQVAEALTQVNVPSVENLVEQIETAVKFDKPLFQKNPETLLEAMAILEKLSVTSKNNDSLNKKVLSAIDNLTKLSSEKHIKMFTGHAVSLPSAADKKKVAEKKVALPENFPTFPVTKKAIEKQATLFRAVRESETWEKLKNTDVYVGKREDGTVASYFKPGVTDDVGAGLMEQLIWDIAVIMGDERDFVPTKITTVEIENGKVKGSVQPSQDGELFIKMISDSEKLRNVSSRQQVVQAIIKSISYGMWDLHARNFIVKEDGNIAFFDNTRNLPHSNEAVFRDVGMLIPFRSDLNIFPQSAENWSSEDRQVFIEEINKTRVRFEALKDYMETSRAKGIIKKLPNGWFEPEEVLQAMEERISRLEEAVIDPNVKNGDDLMFAVYPQLKMKAVCSLMLGKEQLRPLRESRPMDMSEEVWNNQRGLLIMFGQAEPIRDVLANYVDWNVDLKRIQEFCDQQKPFREIVQDVVDYIYERNNAVPTEDEKIAAEEHYQQIVDGFKEKARFDMKDADTKTTDKVLLFTLIYDYSDTGLPKYKQFTSQSAMDNHIAGMKPLEEELVLYNPRGGDPQFMVLSKDLDGKTNRIILDYKKVPGRLVAEGEDRAMTIKEVNDSFPPLPNFYKVDLNNRHEANNFMKKQPNRSWCLRPSKRRPSELKLTRKDRKGRMHHERLKAVSDSEVRYDGKTLTLNQLVALMEEKGYHYPQ